MDVHVANIFWQVPQIPAFCLLASNISISDLSPLQGRRVNRLPSLTIFLNPLHIFLTSFSNILPRARYEHIRDVPEQVTDENAVSGSDSQLGCVGMRMHLHLTTEVAIPAQRSCWWCDKRGRFRICAITTFRLLAMSYIVHLTSMLQGFKPCFGMASQQKRTAVTLSISESPRLCLHQSRRCWRLDQLAWKVLLDLVAHGQGESRLSLAAVSLALSLCQDGETGQKSGPAVGPVPWACLFLKAR